MCEHKNPFLMGMIKLRNDTEILSNKYCINLKLYPYIKEINFGLFAKNREKSCKKKFFLLQFTLSNYIAFANVIYKMQRCDEFFR